MRPGLLLVIPLLLAAACGGGQASSPSATIATVTASPRPTRPPTPTPSPPPVPPPGIDLSLSRARQGGFLVVRLMHPPSGLPSASVSFAGGDYPMLLEGDHWYRVIGLGTDFPVSDQAVAVDGPGGPIASATASIADGGFQFESIELPPSSIGLLNDQAAVQQERDTLAQVYAGFSPGRRWSGPWILPAQGNITNPFGLMRSINGGPYSPHTGTDVANVKGTPVVAAATGTVVLARPLYLYGNAVVIDHGAGVFTSYNHLDSIAVQEGQQVQQGQVLGAMGETGFVNGPHVHWEAIIGGVRTDPTIWTQADIEP